MNVMKVKGLAGSLALLVLLAALALLAAAALAPAAGAAVVWRVDPLASTTVAPGGTLSYRVQITNIGDTDADASQVPITFSGTLPTGLTISSVTEAFPGGTWDCSTVVAGDSSFTCTSTTAFLSQWAFTTLAVNIAVDPTASGTLTSSFTVSGGDPSTGDPSNPTTTTPDPTTISATPPGFGVDAFDGAAIADPSGTPFTQAGGHPYAITTSIDFNTLTNPAPLKGSAWPVEPTKDVFVDLPPGLVGNPTGLAQCTLGQLANGVGTESLPLCPPSSQVGVTLIRTTIGFGITPGLQTVVGPLPVYNMVPPPGVPARFGFNAAGSIITLDARLRSASDYGLSVDVRNISEGLAVAGTTLTFWGVPADPVHDHERACPNSDAPSSRPGAPFCRSGAPLTAFLRNPTSCSAPGSDALKTTLTTDSWFNPGAFTPPVFFTPHDLPGFPTPSSDWGPPLGTTGCDRVPFLPGIDTRPVTAAAGQPSEFRVDVSLPQSDDPTTIDEADLRSAVVSLPAGVRVNPSSASGLAGCSPAQIGIGTTNEPSCPDGSKIGTVRIVTPLLRDPLEGSVYLASPHDNPFGTLLGIYIVAEGSGTIVKLSGRVDANPITGQLTTTVDNNPQLPFDDVILDLNGGSRAPLTMPSGCGTYTTTTAMVGWNELPASPQARFTISGDGKGAPCSGRKFAPGFTAGTQNPVAGGFSPFGMQLTRTDDDGEFSSLSSLSLPKGLLANVSSITTRCTIEQADAHACPADSHIGTVTTGAGAGPDPFYVGGDVYLIGPYKGNPFGVAVVVHALAGPFDLGYVVVKGAIQIHDDGSVTVATDPFPTILQGIPLQVKDIRVNLDRPGFMFNPTSCNPTSINGTVLSTDNQQAGVSSRFQVGECASLAFKPRFSASTSGSTSKANGASFHVHLASNEGPHGTSTAGESNIAKVDVQLPVSLPARLTTLQKACTAAQFAANPAGCPVASFVGSAVAHTPILASPLSGPAILVSHGGQAFPDLVLVLQGEGIRIDLTGHTQIKSGITFSHFETVPDAPVSSFDLTLPQGPHSALTTDIPGRNLCANTRTVTVTKRVTSRIHGHNRKVTVRAKKAISTALLMPTTLTAQNGAVIHQNTKIAVTGCAKAKTVKHKTKRKRK